MLTALSRRPRRFLITPGIVRGIDMETQIRAPLPESLSLPPVIADAAGSDEAIRERIHRLADDVIVTVTPQTITGRRLQDDRGVVAEHDVHEYDPDPVALGKALWQLEKAGFKIHRRGRFAVTVSAPAQLIRDLLQVPLSVQRRPLRHGATAAEKFALADKRPNPAELFVAPANLSIPAKNMPMDHFVFIPPPLLYAPSANPPAVGYRHIAADEVRKLLNVPTGASASGVRLAIVDTGFADHPFYSQQIDFHEVPGGPVRGDDHVGHGTAVTWNAIAVAPDVSAVVLGYSAVVQDAIEIAVDDEHAAVVSCSWGWDHEQVFPVVEASIRSVVEDDKVVVLVAAGNG
ncbi:MAG TPA: S8/S53 family peptidase [Thermoanaerobaculia bacterium]